MTDENVIKGYFSDKELNSACECCGSTKRSAATISLIDGSNPMICIDCHLEAIKDLTMCMDFEIEHGMNEDK